MSRRWARLVNQTADMLNRLDTGVRAPRARPSDLIYIDDKLGQGYAHLTSEDVQAVQEAEELEGLKLEGTYTGKALAGAIAMGRELRGSEKMLFLNTYNSADFTPRIKELDYHLLPEPFHRFFEKPYRELEYEP